MAADKQVKEILAAIEKSIVNFGKTIPGIEEGIAETLIEQLKGLQTQNGKILNSVQNLKLLGSLANKLERLIISEGYKDSVKDFANAFDIVEGLQAQYFAAFNNKFKPSKVLPILKQQAVDKTINGLIGQGLGVNIVDRIGAMVGQAITTGGSYASLTEQLRNSVRGNSEQEGMLQKYTRTITTDAINQYSAQYHETIAQDLGFNWMRYVGSNITTTREFCERLTAKEWIHKSELPEIVKGKIDGVQCKLNKQGLPLGMIPGTDKDNFKIRRGGFNCGHQAFWVPDSAVPDDLKRRLVEPKATAKEKVDMNIIKDGNLGPYLESKNVQKAIKDIFNELSKEEKTAIYAYTGNEYNLLNKFLRGVHTPKNKTYWENYKNLLSNAIDSAKEKYQGWVFRGITASREDIQKYYDGHEKGTPVTNAEFTSTSYTIGSEFGGNVKFSIYSKRGVKIEGLSLHGSADKEVLLNSGTRFKVLSIREDKGTTYIKMEEI